ncbi:helix-turn-helix domain-containing protein [Pareuzebyella sediminis]|uniref:helix-turn-helix domain-containing protein n=1 Tax=Pareuzebyella sediminis TaxID=2607998 RepID=UPI0011ED3839|nr:AraC family transcriptional regulator [Pareuzebyella sediminis]
MFEIVITSNKDEKLLSQIHTCLGGTLSDTGGGSVLRFDNDVGKGVVRNISFDGGISLLDCDVTLSKEVTLLFKASDVSPIKFLFISEGTLNYSVGNAEEPIVFERFQNIIVSEERLAKKGYAYAASNRLKLNCIRISRKAYLKKKNNNVNTLDSKLRRVFTDTKGAKAYLLQGGYNLKIADEIKKLNEVPHKGMFSTLSIEGRVYLILALQLQEHDTFLTEGALPHSLSRQDIKKIHELTDFILTNISRPITVEVLANASGLSAKKLQLGFKMSYSKTVNGYVRELKLKLARDYLKNTDLSISEIVYAVGIKSRSYFSKIFFEAYGLLPTDYRKQLKLGKHTNTENQEP